MTERAFCRSESSRLALSVLQEMGVEEGRKTVGLMNCRFVFSRTPESVTFSFFSLFCLSETGGGGRDPLELSDC